MSAHFRMIILKQTKITSNLFRKTYATGCVDIKNRNEIDSWTLQTLIPQPFAPLRSQMVLKGFQVYLRHTNSLVWMQIWSPTADPRTYRLELSYQVKTVQDPLI